MSVVEGVAKLAANYEDIKTDVELRLKERVSDEDQIETSTETLDTEAVYLKRCLSHVLSLGMCFIQSLDMYREKHEEHQGVSSQLEEKLSEAKKNVKTLQKELDRSVETH
eukprot:382694_1